MGIEHLGRRFVQLGESLLRFGQVAASDDRAYKSVENKPAAPLGGATVASAGELRVRLLILPPSDEASATPAATRPATQPTP